jgi:membrane protease YdiL (CAAX protease family)
MIIFAGYFIAQLFVVALVDIVGGDRVGPLTDFLCPIVGIVVMVPAALVLVPEDLRKTVPTGPAWAFGGWEGVMNGLVIGSFLGLGSLVLDRAYHPYSTPAFQKIEPGLITPGVQQLATIAAIVFLGPLSEEMMFRGVLYGGCRRSLGPLSAATITTGIFVAMHFPYYIYAPYNIVLFIVASLAFLWCRLKWNAIGPATAAHGGCNLVAAVVPSVHWTWLHYHSL